MSPVSVGIIGLVVFFILLAFGLPVGVGMALVGAAGIWYLLSGTAAISVIATEPFLTAADYSLTVLPLFMLMAHIAFASGISGDMYNLAGKWLGHQRGGIAMATVAGCAGFAAVSASSLATAATMGSVALPEMKRLNYHPALATGTIAAGGTMGMMIPPSGMLIVYGVLTETSIGRLFIAGIVPGLIEAVFYFFAIYILCRWKPNYGPRGPSYSLREKVAAFGSCGEMIALVFLVLGGLIIGWFSPTEAGAVGAFGAILFSMIRRRLNWQKFKQAVLEALKSTGMIYFILIGAFIFKYFLAVTTIPFVLSDFVEGINLSPVVVMGIIILIYVLLGCFMDSMAMVLLTLPVFFPLALTLGFDPVWFGIIIVAVVEIAAITPPFGINVYVIAGVVPDVPMQTIFKGIMPFFIADICRVALYLFIPATVLFLPNLMMG